MTDTDWAKIAEPVAVALLGDPSRKTSKAIRWGRKGSFSLNTETGIWTDFEAGGESGGVLALVMRERRTDRTGGVQWLQDQGFISPQNRPGAIKGADRHPPAQPGKPPEIAKQAASRDKVDKGKADARRIWNAGSRGDGTAAHAYLTRRFTWPPVEMNRPLPDSVRYLGRADFPEKVGMHPPPCAGFTLYAFRDRSGELVACALEALQPDGRRLDPRWRRTRGNMTGATFTVRPGAEEGRVHLAEGPADALALCHTETGAVHAVGGTSGLQAPPPGTGPVILHADGDGPGRQAAEQARQTIRKTGRACSVRWCGPGSDPAGDLRDRLEERAAIRKYCGSQSMTQAERAAWAELIEQTKRGNA